MSAPQTIVTFRDEDEDEFPVSIHAVGERDAIVAIAQKRANQFIRSGDWRPAGQLRVTKVEAAA